MLGLQRDPGLLSVVRPDMDGGPHRRVGADRPGRSSSRVAGRRLSQACAAEAPVGAQVGVRGFRFV
jgi:hypothetical protein